MDVFEGAQYTVAEHLRRQVARYTAPNAQGTVRNEPQHWTIQVA